MDIIKTNTLKPYNFSIKRLNIFAKTVRTFLNNALGEHLSEFVHCDNHKTILHVFKLFTTCREFPILEYVDFHLFKVFYILL